MEKIRKSASGKEGVASLSPNEIKRVKLFRKCSHIAKHEDILGLFVKTVRSIGIVGEELIVKLLFLCLTTRFLRRPVSVAIMGESSAGKSYVVNTVVNFMPESAYYILTSMSDKALVYSKVSFENRFLVIHELHGIKGGDVDYFIRVLMSEGFIRYEVTGKGTITKPGPTGLITTTQRSACIVRTIPAISFSISMTALSRPGKFSDTREKRPQQGERLIRIIPRRPSHGSLFSSGWS